VSCRTRFIVSICFLIHGLLAFSQQEPVTADQVIARYLEAVGAARFSLITTFVKRGDLYGNLTNFWRGSRSPVQSQNKERGTFEFYFKSPNLRFGSTVTEKNAVVALYGCDGQKAWYIDAALNRSEFKPKPGNEYACEEGLEPMPTRLSDPKTRMRLVKKKEVDGHMAWEIKVDDSKSQWSTTYDFDVESYLLLRSAVRGSVVMYSDYRDVGGIKIPFISIRESDNSRLVTTLREVKINGPIDDARFAELQPKGGVVAVTPASPPNLDQAKAQDLCSTKTRAPATEIPVTAVNFPNFTACTIAELQLIVPELTGLKVAPDQDGLATLLSKVGRKMVDTARNTPNLISHEIVTESRQGAVDVRREYNYLILTRVEGTTDAVLNEFRVDIKTGAKFQTEDIMKDSAIPSESTPSDPERTSHEGAASQFGQAPTSQGFATSWVYFYPLTQAQSTFRYLGEQKVDGQRTLVLAFAQKPQVVRSPGLFRSEGKTVPMFFQGVAWFDPSDFRILRLRTDLLSPLPEVSLHRLTADIQFLPTRLAEVPSLLFLPHEVTVTSEVNGSTLRENHTYSDYRLFRSRSRILPDP
jgi:hypothetical protein